MKKTPASYKIALAAFMFIAFASFALGAQALGDVNSNGTVDIVDALLIAQYYVGLNPANFNPDVADVNCSGSIDIVDSLIVAQYYVGLISQFPCTAEPSPTPDLTGQYVLHVAKRVYNSGSPSVTIPYTGDYSGTGLIPFDIGPYPNPFTVTLTAPTLAFYMGVQPFKFYRWEDADRNSITANTSVSVTINETNPDQTIYAAFQDESYILTPIPTPIATPNP
jgi:hypothetical protein